MLMDTQAVLISNPKTAYPELVETVRRLVRVGVGVRVRVRVRVSRLALIITLTLTLTRCAAGSPATRPRSASSCARTTCTAITSTRCAPPRCHRSARAALPPRRTATAPAPRRQRRRVARPSALTAEARPQARVAEPLVTAPAPRACPSRLPASSARLPRPGEQHHARQARAVGHEP